MRLFRQGVPFSELQHTCAALADAVHRTVDGALNQLCAAVPHACAAVLTVGAHGAPRYSWYSTVFHGTPRYSTVLTVLAALNQRAHCGGQHSTVRRLFSSHSSAMPSAAAAAADCVGLRTQYLHVRRHSGGLAWRATVTACSAAVRIVCSRPHWVGISTVRYTYGLLYVFGSDSSTVLSHYCIPQRFGMRWSVGNICRC